MAEPAVGGAGVSQGHPAGQAADGPATHTYGPACLPCSEPPHVDGRGKRVLATCVHVQYSRAEVAFVLKHKEEAATIAYAPSHATSRRLLARWSREMVRIKGVPGHSCDCVRPWEREGCASWSSPKHNPRNHRCGGPPSPACLHCAQVKDQDKYVWVDEGTEVGRTDPVEAPMPSERWLDIVAAIAATGSQDAKRLCEWLNSERKVA